LQEQFLNGKVLIFKKRRRKNSRRLNGHRQVFAYMLIKKVMVIRPAKHGAQGTLPSFHVFMQELTGLRITDVHGLEAATSGNVQ
jgi:hypothetical protein